MSRLGEFAERYEQVQRGLQEMAERRLAKERQSQTSVIEQIRQLQVQKTTARNEMLGLSTGAAWKFAWERLRLLEARERELQEALLACQERISASTAEVRTLYQEAERWDALATQEANHAYLEEERKTLRASDELATQAHGRTVP